MSFVAPACCSHYLFVTYQCWATLVVQNSVEFLYSKDAIGILRTFDQELGVFFLKAADFVCR